jgi:hypothetical protein
MNSLALLPCKHDTPNVTCGGWICDSYKLDLGEWAGVYKYKLLQLGLELFHEVF